MKIAIQSDLQVLDLLLKEKGYETVPYRQSGMDCHVAIINNIDEEYEEMEPVSYLGDQMMILNASRLSQEQVLSHIKNFSQTL